MLARQEVEGLQLKGGTMLGTSRGGEAARVMTWATLHSWGVLAWAWHGGN